MAIKAGQQLLHYRVVEKIGEGGMGVVWKAVDTTLDREVAIKVLPGAFAENSERLARFEREAKLLASLNHPNLATIFGVHSADASSDSRQAATRFLAMELVPGEDLAQRLKRGRLSIDDAVGIVQQVAVALEAAHGRGVVHRDLKPANIRVMGDGTVKVLDFGLAKVMTSSAAAAADPNLSPTMTSVGSVAGVLLGTAGYMSPEQARGLDVDERSDIWSFGCVLWECLTGTMLFGGATATDSLGAILHTEPDWSELPVDTPPAVLRLLRRCLAKKPHDRLHHIADARLELQNPDRTPPTTVRPPRNQSVVVGVLAIAVILSLSIALWAFSRPTTGPAGSQIDNPLAGARFTRLTDSEASEFDAAISPDGRFAAFVSNRNGPYEVFVGQVGAGGFRKLASGADDLIVDDARAPVRSVGFNHDGSEVWLAGAALNRVRSLPLLGGPVRNFLGEHVVDLAWSPDGKRIAYHERLAGDPLYVADRNGENQRLILDPPAGMHQHYPIWSVDGEWIFVTRGRPQTLEMDLWRVRPNGEDLEQLTYQKLDVSYPAPIDERTVLYSARDADGAGPWLWAVDVESRISRRASVGLEQYSSVAAAADGHRMVATVQEPKASLWTVPILDRVASEADARPFADLNTERALAPRLGGSTLFYLSSRGSGDGLWRYQDGTVAELWKGSDTSLLEPVAVSPDGASLALVLRRPDGWHLNVLSADGAKLRTLSKAVDVRGAAAWSPDGDWIATGGSVEGVEGLYKVPIDGGPPVRLAEGEALNPVWSPTGEMIVYSGAQVNIVTPLLAVHLEGEPIELPTIKVLRAGERVRFLPDGSGIVYLLGDGPSQDFWLLDLVTMESRRLTRLDSKDMMRTFDITSDGTTIVFDRLTEASDIVLIELKPAE